VAFIWGEPILPHLQNAFMPVYVAAFIATIAVMWALCPHVDAHAALVEVSNGGGWSSTGLALMVGQISSIFALGGSDAAAHMSEEVRHAGLSVPRAMVWSIVINAGIGFVAVISFLFACPSVDDAVNDASGFPLVYVLNLAGMPDLTLGLR
jgi:choline transport protein